MVAEVGQAEAVYDTQKATDRQPEREGCEDKQENKDGDKGRDGEEDVMVDGHRNLLIKDLCTTVQDINFAA